jgi:hypothetical protein
VQAPWWYALILNIILMSYHHLDWHNGGRQHYLHVSAKIVEASAILKELWLGEVWLGRSLSQHQTLQSHNFTNIGN